MKILVCIKQVPDTTEITIDKETGRLNRDGVPSILNPFDEYALELALKIKENNDAEITILSMGPEQAKEAIRTCLAMGADKGFLVTDRLFGGSDTLATSYILSESIKSLGDFDLILCGKQAIDGDTGQVGPEISQLLDISLVCNVRELNVEEDLLIGLKESDDSYEKFSIELPCLITATKTEEQPRLPSMKGQMLARRKEIGIITSETINIDNTKIGLKGSPTRVVRSFTPKIQKEGTVYENKDTSESVDLLMQYIEKII